jgi:cellobiose-specific phosphotransferase system component IIB
LRRIYRRVYMRKILIAMACIAGMSAAVFAQDNNNTDNEKKRDLSIWGGYSSLNMKTMNDELDQLKALSGGDVTKVNNGYFFAGELTFWEVAPKLMLGPRVEYLMANQGKVSSGANEYKEDHSLLPVMVGGRYKLKNGDATGMSFNDKWGLNVGAYVGYGWATMKTSVKRPLIDTSVDATGGGVAGDALVGWEYSFSKTFGIGVDLGYRYATVPEMKATSDNAVLGVSKDEVIKDSNGNTVDHDFSGLIAAVGLKFKM